MLPQASAIGNIHIGTIAGKLNGVMPAHTPSGWRSDQLSMPRADLLGELALQQMRDAAGELDDLDAAGDLALGVGKHLAVLFRDRAGQRVVLARQELQELEQDAGAGQRRRRGPAGKRLGGGLHRSIDLGAAAQRHPPDALAGRRVEYLAPAPAVALGPLAIDEMLNVAHCPSTRRL